MNIQNILALANQLQSLGFENAGYLLLKRICFKPDFFLFSQTIEKGNDKLSFQFYCEKDKIQNVYVLKYYDAILQKEAIVEDITRNGINTNALQNSMVAIDWKSAFDFATNKPFNWEDEKSWDKEREIEAIIDGLSILQNSEDGKVIATGLKLKFWSGSPYHELFGNIIPLKNKSDINQRFYFFEGHAGISVDEAYRFLQNRWLEKQMQTKRKEPGKASLREADNHSQASTVDGVMQKKRLSKPKGVKRNKSIQN